MLFRKFVTKNTAFPNNTSFLEQFFRFRGVGDFPLSPDYNLAYRPTFSCMASKSVTIRIVRERFQIFIRKYLWKISFFIHFNGFRINFVILYKDIFSNLYEGCFRVSACSWVVICLLNCISRLLSECNEVIME